MPLQPSPIRAKLAGLRDDSWQTVGKVVRPVIRIFTDNPHAAIATSDAVNRHIHLYPTDYRENNYVAQKVDNAIAEAKKRRKRADARNKPVGLQKSANVPVDHWGNSTNPRGNGPSAHKPLPETLYAENTLAAEKNRLLGQEQALIDIAANKKNLASTTNTSLQTPYTMQNVFGTTYGNYGLVTSGLVGA